MSEADGPAVPVSGDEGVVVGRLRAYLTQLWADARALYIELLSKITVSLTLDWFLRVVSALMILFPIGIFFDYLGQGILLISPPLLFMVLAGFTGLALPPRGEAHEEQLSRSCGRK